LGIASLSGSSELDDEDEDELESESLDESESELDEELDDELDELELDDELDRDFLFRFAGREGGTDAAFNVLRLRNRYSSNEDSLSAFLFFGSCGCFPAGVGSNETEIRSPSRITPSPSTFNSSRRVDPSISSWICFQVTPPS
jgi:hypothetical protein